MDKRIVAYLKELCGQIRFRQAHERIRHEMATHILDQRDNYMTRGMNREEATELSILHTGDPVELGVALDRIHRPQGQWKLLSLCILLLLCGQAFPEFSMSWGWMLFGISLLATTYLSDLSILRELTPLLNCIFFFFMILFYIIIQNRYAYSAHSVNVLILAPTLFGVMLYNLRNGKQRAILIALGTFFISLCCLILVNSPPALFIFICTALILLIYAQSQAWFGLSGWKSNVALFAPIATVALAMLPLLKPISQRLVALTQPIMASNKLDVVPDGIRGLWASSVPWGIGGNLSDESAFVLDLLGNIEFSLWNMPIGLSRLSYHYGWLSALLVVTPIFLFFILGFRKGLKQSSYLARFASLSVLLTLSFQMIGYLMNNFGFLIGQGLSLPLLTSQNSIFTSNMVLVGLLLSALRSGAVLSDGPPQWKWMQLHKATEATAQETESVEKETLP